MVFCDLFVTSVFLPYWILMESLWSWSYLSPVCGLSFSKLEKSLLKVTHGISVRSRYSFWRQDDTVMKSDSGSDSRASARCLSSLHIHSSSVRWGYCQLSWIEAKLPDIGRIMIKNESHGTQCSRSQCRSFWFLKIYSFTEITLFSTWYTRSTLFFSALFGYKWQNCINS